METYQVLRIKWESACCTSQADGEKTFTLKHMTLKQAESYTRKVLKCVSDEKWKKYWKVILEQEYLSHGCGCDCGDVVIIKPEGEDIRFNEGVYRKMERLK
jgi:hypothetical protein